jgi:hypothetical protein
MFPAAFDHLRASLPPTIPDARHHTTNQHTPAQRDLVLDAVQSVITAANALFNIPKP